MKALSRIPTALGYLMVGFQMHRAEETGYSKDLGQLLHLEPTHQPMATGTLPKMKAAMPGASMYGSTVVVWDWRSQPVERAVMIVVSAIGEQQFPKMDPPRIEPTHCRAMASLW
jgi:hypothetical protein